MEKKLFKHAFIVLLVLGILDFFGMAFYLYWTTWSFDIIMHFLAGVCVAMGGVSVWMMISKNKNISFSRLLVIGLFWAIFIGVIWEIYELYFGVAMLSDGAEYYIDTGSDLVMDTLGGLLGTLYSFKILSKKS